MTENELDKAKERLFALREKLEETGDVAEASGKTVELDQCVVGRLSRMDALQQQAMSIEQNRRRKERIKRVNAALARIENDDYGWCQDCGEAINTKRLEIDPAAAYCIACADRH